MKYPYIAHFAAVATALILAASAARAAEPANDLSIAFLPLEATTAHAGAEAAALAPAVAAQIASKDPGIRVVVGDAKPGDKPADTAGALNVRFLFSGTVGGEDAYMANIVVTDAKTGAVIMKATFFSDEDNIPTLPGEIAGGLLQALRAAKL